MLHRVLHDVEENYSLDTWAETLRSKIPQCTEQLAGELVDTLKYDCGVQA